MKGYDWDLTIFNLQGKRISSTSSRSLRIVDVVTLVSNDLNGVMDSHDVRTVSLVVSRVEDDVPSVPPLD